MARFELANRPPRLCYASFVRCLRIHQTLCPLFALGLFVAVAATAQKPAAGQKVVQNPTEYDAYAAAVKTQDATARAEALEAFAQEYPHSAVLTDALQQEMAAWQTAGKPAKVKQAAERLLTAEPGNIRVLGIVVALDRASAERGDLAALNEMCVDASGGMLAVPMWRKPANMTDADFASLSKLMSDIFVGAEGYCAVQQKNYSQARDWLTRAYKIDPKNVQDTYQLAVADLESTPQVREGFWYCARAIHLAQSSAIPRDPSTMMSYCKAKYTSYHGAVDGWDELAAGVAKQDTPPPDFAKRIKAAPAVPASGQK
jgi:tetratricopeptide (TPR) repeat protein